MTHRTGLAVIETITPDVAEELLKINRTNRPQTRLVINQYATAMKQGRWKLNGETIKLDTHGHLLDGQHRLMACVESECSFQSYVAYDVERDTFDTIDVGKKRSAGDILSIEGAVDGKSVAAAIRYVDQIQRKNITPNKLGKLTADQVLAIFQQDAASFADSVRAATPALRILGRAMGGALHYLFKQNDPTGADDFFEDLASGANLAADDPVFLLRERLLALRLAKGTPRPAELISLCIRAWNRRRTGGGRANVIRGLTRNHNNKLTMPEIS